MKNRQQNCCTLQYFVHTSAHLQRFSAVRLLLDAMSKVSIGSMLSFLEPTWLSCRLMTFIRLTSPSPSNDWRKAPMSLAPMSWRMQCASFHAKGEGFVSIKPYISYVFRANSDTYNVIEPSDDFGGARRFIILLRGQMSLETGTGNTYFK